MKDRTEENHESFGLLQISRQSCRPAMNVFGSSVKTENPISLRIKRAVKHRGLNRHWYYSTEEIVEVIMSPAQFADAITTLNSGSGTPVTIRYVNRKEMESCPETSQTELFHEEFKNKIKDVVSDLTNLLKVSKEVLQSKGQVKVADKNKLHGLITKVEQEIRANMPFVHEQYMKAMDKTTSEAKAEIEAFMNNSIMNAGIEAISNKNSNPEITYEETETE